MSWPDLVVKYVVFHIPGHQLPTTVTRIGYYWAYFRLHTLIDTALRYHHIGKIPQSEADQAPCSEKMPQRRDNAGAVCDSGMACLNRQFWSYRRLLHQKMGQNFPRVLLVPSEVVQLRRTMSGDVANFRPIRGREIISHKLTNSQTQNQHTVRPCSTSSACKNINI